MATYEAIMSDTTVQGATSMANSRRKILLDLCSPSQPGPFSDEEKAAIIDAALAYKNAENARCRAIAAVAEAN